MKTLVFNGSPRIHGDTRSLIELFQKEMPGEVTVVDAYRSRISGCVDCRRCRKESGCAIEDEMQEVYRKIREADCILIASPVYFSELTGRLLDVLSRLQTFFCARYFRKTEEIPKPKKGAILLVGGGDGKPDRAAATAKTLLHQMNAKDVAEPVIYHNSNQSPAIEDETVCEGVRGIVRFFTQEEEKPVRNIGVLPLKPDNRERIRRLMEELEK